ncbi:MAG: hypothetical protein V3W11_13265 [bacterium]
MRRLVTVLTALLLATAAAAGAGDDIKWKRSKKLDFVPINSNTEGISDNYEKTTSKYSLKWTPFGHHKIGFIQVVLHNWEVYVSDLKAQAKAGKIDANTLPAAVAKGIDVYPRYFTFYVSINTFAPLYSFLVEGGPWTIYLVDPVSGKPVAPVSIEPIGEPLIGVFEVGSVYGGKGMLISAATQTTYKVIFAYANASSYCASLKLVLTCDLCRRGFEWRFVEE